MDTVEKPRKRSSLRFCSNFVEDITADMEREGIEGVRGEESISRVESRVDSRARYSIVCPLSLFCYTRI